MPRSLRQRGSDVDYSYPMNEDKWAPVEVKPAKTKKKSASGKENKPKKKSKKKVKKKKIVLEESMMEDDEDEEEEEEEVVVVKRPRKKQSSKPASSSAAERAQRMLKEMDFEDRMAEQMATKDAMYQKLLQQYQEVKESKREELVEALKKYKQEARIKQAATDKLVAFWKESVQKLEAGATSTAQYEALEKENQVLRDQLAAEQAARATADEELHSAQAKHTRTVAKMQEQHKQSEMQAQQIEETYRLLTSTLVTVQPNGKVRCKTVNRDDVRMIEFDLDLEDSSQVNYEPRRVAFNGAPYPAWFTKPIDFPPAQGPKFTKTLLSTIFGSSSSQPAESDAM